MFRVVGMRLLAEVPGDVALVVDRDRDAIFATECPDVFDHEVQILEHPIPRRHVIPDVQNTLLPLRGG